jgi:hypothetical protein
MPPCVSCNVIHVTFPVRAISTCVPDVISLLFYTQQDEYQRNKLY